MSVPEPINVVVAMDFSDEIMQRLREVSPRLRVERHFPNVTDKAWAQAEILYTVSKFPLPEQAPRLRWIQFHSAGIDHAVKEAVFETPDIMLTTTNGIHAVNMAEFSLGMMLAFSYKIPEMLRLQAKADWSKDRTTIFPSLTLRGQTVGIVGYGAIGRELARQANALGMTVLAIKRDVMHPVDDTSYREPGTGDPAGEIPARLYPPEAIASMAKECDFLVLLMPLTNATRGMVNAEVLKSMKKTAVLINLARGGVVDEPALIEALKNGEIAGAGLDVFSAEPLPPDSPLWAMENVIISPHIAGLRADYHARAADVFAENLRRYLRGEALINVVNRETGY